MPQAGALVTRERCVTGCAGGRVGVGYFCQEEDGTGVLSVLIFRTFEGRPVATRVHHAQTDEIRA
jgi:hypothetical protein